MAIVDAFKKFAKAVTGSTPVGDTIEEVINSAAELAAANELGGYTTNGVWISATDVSSWESSTGDLLDAEKKLEEGKTYTVVCNGVTREVTPTAIDSGETYGTYLIMGNPYLAGSSMPKEPGMFAIWSKVSETGEVEPGVYFTGEDTYPSTFDVSIVCDFVVPINSKYLPE